MIEWLCKPFHVTNLLALYSVFLLLRNAYSLSRCESRVDRLNEEIEKLKDRT